MPKAVLLATLAAALAAAPAFARCPDTAPLFSDARVMFEPGGAVPGPQAEEEIRAIVARAQMVGGGTLCVYGHSAGRAEGDLDGGLAAERAETVAAALRRAGIEPSRIRVVEAPREDRLLSALGIDEAARRADIVLEP